MKKVAIIAALMGATIVSACAQSISETSYVDGQQVMMQVRATPNAEWEFLINGQVVAKDKVQMAFDNVLTGVHNGKQYTVRMYYRSNGWVAHKTADVFADGQLVETLVIS